MRLLLLLFFIPLCWAACEGNISYYVPAVVGNQGGLVNITMSLAPGEGNIYTSVYPRTGLTTQESIVDAVSYAAELSDEDETCNIIVDFGKSASEIEGPSAGAAMTVMAYALFEGNAIRKDTIITGTIGPGGEVGPVGGLYEKAKGAAAMGADYFITPVETLYEVLLMRTFEDRYGLTVLQARTVDEIIGFMIHGMEIDQQGLRSDKRPIPQLEQYPDGVPGFAGVARNMIALEEGTVAKIPEADSESRTIRDFFGNEIDRQGEINGKGYHFSAANEAFLNYIDMSTILVILNGSADLARKKGEAGICLSQVKRPAMTESNFEWLAGSDLRVAWALERLKSTNVTEDFLAEEEFIIYNELMYAQAWCLVAKELAAAAPEDGRAVDEGAWKSLAEDKLRQARSLEITNADSESRMNSAQDSFARGRFGAAILDASYVIAAEGPSAANDTSVLSEPRDSLWGKVYQSHAAFLESQNQTSAALRTARLASVLDDAARQMRSAMKFPEASGPAQAVPPAIEETAESPDNTIFYLLAAGILFLLVIVVIILLRGIYGGRKGPLKAYGAKQKKGGARVPEADSRP